MSDADTIVNPRRAPRARVRCACRVSAPAGVLDAETEDLGPSGCQLRAAGAVARGEAVRLELSHPLLAAPVAIAGRVAWASAQAPWRLGVAFDVAELERAGRWYQALLASSSGIGPGRRLPDRIPLDATIWLGAPPRFVDLDRSEIAILRAVGDGASLRSVAGALGPRWPQARRALFSLLAHQYLTFARGGATRARDWERTLLQAEVALTPEAPAAMAAPAPAAAAPAAVGVPARAAVRAAGGAAAPGAPPARSPDFVGAGVGWRGAAGRPRPPEAAECLERARGELAEGRVHGAIALLRRALAVAPGDPEIAGVLGRLAFDGRRSA
ncbi:type IV pilus assembly PilZ [Anaeromyxobacter dehalogenans 2CP-1]|uniref:Type IV pilus assembly PilZ n=1 Tax=Anaeromyxobacter dehalogenans (strain ATCC BAA-258 / DSM 21875 / 2CP-1) TaxID=455488 RepID=B8JFD9_ANAD2|nr:PilZ domain-containing protein [Anaeromyxobacter dehalogenans]ACL66316.1 type IV pilus assembly PilZ [Anaeromyxobacter dehalogenans 2CP-1]